MMKAAAFFGLVAATGLALSAAAQEPEGFAHWTLADSLATEAKLAADPGTARQNPMFSYLELASGDNVRRTSFGKSGIAEVHENSTDVFCFLSGDGELVVGGSVVNPKTTNPGEIRGPSIAEGFSKRITAGDVVVVPPGTPHQILIPEGKRLTFMVAKMRK